MKTISKMIFLSIAVAMFSCSDDTGTSEDPDVVNPDPVDPIEETVGKKGSAYANVSQRWSYRTSDMNAHWMYSWGNLMRDEIPGNVEFVPMVWGRNAAQSDDVINRLKDLKNEGKIKYLLGFNEPDGASQANMSVDEAIELWPRLEEVGVPLGSPATVNPNNEWMQEFMQRADAEGLRVDFITVHHYGGTNVPNFINKLSTTYQAYGQRPIWITEFAVADWNATSPENNVHSRQDVINFMESALPALEQIDYVERYSWFDGTQAPLYTSSLFDEDQNITSVGQAYANFSPNNEIGPGQDTEFVPPVVDGEIFINGGFETAQIAPWGGFKNGVVGIGTTEPLTGNFSGRIENGDGSLFYELDVEAGQTFELKYNTKWRDPVGETIRVGIRNNNVEGADGLLFQTEELAMTTEWTAGSYEFTVPAGVTQIRIIFYKANGYPPLFFDDLSLMEVE
jgi:hypothetical protein